MIRLVHLSDLHLGCDQLDYGSPFASSLAGVETDALARLSRTAAHPVMARRKPTPEGTHCVVSGDLSARGCPAELRDGLTYVHQALVPSTKASPVGLNYGEGRASITLGNHDVWRGRHPFSVWVGAGTGARLAQRMVAGGFPERWRYRSRRQQGTAEFADAGALRVRVYLLDSTLPGFRNVFARGRVSARQLDELEAMIAADAKVDVESTAQCLRVVLLHHPLCPPNGHRLQMVLEDSDHVRRCLETLRVGMVLCGHEHLCDVRELVPGMWQCVSGSATQTTRAREHNEFLTYDIDAPNERCVVTVRRYRRSCEQGSDFAEVEQRSIEPVVALL
jgi:3',5'-cyclic AMP phosphodiesterase CpdA